MTGVVVAIISRMISPGERQFFQEKWLNPDKAFGTAKYANHAKPEV
jgi:hypothetical protein